MNRIVWNRVLLFVMVPVLVLICCVFVYKNSEAESTGNRVDDVASYESVLVCKGDTLWSIAEANLEQPTDTEIRAYVEEITAINGLSSSHIHTGSYLLLPKYKTC